MDDQSFGIGNLLFFIVILVFALHARSLKCTNFTDYQRIMVQRDGTARWLGVMYLMMALLLGFSAAWLPYSSAAAHVIRFRVSFGLAGLCVPVALLGTTYLILGSRAQHIVPTSYDVSTYRIGHWLFITITVIAMLCAMIGFQACLEHFGYKFSRY